MPPVVIAVAAGVAAGVSAASVLVGVAVALGTAALSVAMKPETPKGLIEDIERAQTLTTGSVIPRRGIYGETVVSGTMVGYGKRIDGFGNNAKEYHVVAVAIAGHPCESLSLYKINDKPVPEGTLFKAYLGNQTAVDPVLRQIVTGWTDQHIGKGITYALIQLPIDQDKLPQGLRNITFTVKGKKIYDPRKDSSIGGTGTHRHDDPATWEWSDNPVLCAFDYLRFQGYRPQPISRFDLSDIAAEANVCDESVQIEYNGETVIEKRFTCNGFFSYDEGPADVLQRILTSCAGKPYRRGGKIYVKTASYHGPAVVEITTADLAGRVKYRPNTSERERCNVVRATFVDPSAGYITSESAVLKVDEYVLQDGAVREHEIRLPFTNSSTMAQRLQKYYLERNRAGFAVEATVGPKGLLIEPGKTVALNLAEDGIVGEFIVADWNYDQSKKTVSIVLIIEQPELYGDEIHRRVVRPIFAVPDNTAVAPPQQVAFSGEASGRDFNGVLTWQHPAPASVEAYIVRIYSDPNTQTQGDESLIIEQRIEGTRLREFVVRDLPAGDYIMDVLAVSKYGKETLPARIFVPIYPPAAPTGINVSPGNFDLTVAPIATGLSYNSAFEFDIIVGETIPAGYTPTAKAKGITAIFTGLQPNSNYRVYARTVSPYGVSNWINRTARTAFDEEALAPFIDDIRQQIEQLNTVELVALRSELDQAKQDLENIVLPDLDPVNQEIARVEGLLGTLQTNLNTSLNTLSGNLATLDGELSTLEQQSAANNQALATAQQSLNALSGDLGTLSNDLSALSTSLSARFPIKTADIEDAAINASKLGNLAVTAGKLAANAVTADKIAALAVNADKIAASAVTTAKIADAAIAAGKIAAGAVGTATIAELAITAEKVAALAINATKLADNAVTNAKLDALAVTEAKVASNAISAAKIASNAVTEAKIATNAITAVKIAAAAITEVKIAPSAITAEKIAALAINADKIAANAVTVAKIADGAVAAGKIALGAVTEDTIAELAITAAKVAESAVTVEKIAPGAVIESKIADAAITSMKVANLAINADKVAANAITTAKIAAGAVAAGKIAANAVTATEIANLAITAGKVADSAITTTKIAAGAVDAGKLAAAAVTADKLAALAVNEANIAASAITTAKIADGAIAAGKIAANAVTADKVAALAINADKIASNAITTAKIADGAIASGKIASGAVDAAKLNIQVGGGNLVTDSSFESVPGTWFNYNNSGNASTRFDTGRNGGRSFVSVTGSTPGSTLGASKPAAVQGGWQTGVPYIVSFYARKLNGAGMAGCFLAWNNGPQTTTTLANPALTTNWQRYAFRIQWNAGAVVPTSGGLGSLWISSSGSRVAGDEIWLDDVQVEQADVLTAYAPMVNEILPGTITATQISDDAITTPKLVAGAVAAGKIAASAVSATELAANAVVADKIAANAITAAKIAAGAVEAAKIAAGAVTAGKVAANAITATEIAAGAIVADKIATNAITAVKIAASAIEAGKIAANAVTAAKIAAGAVTAGKVAANAITATEIAAGTITAAEIATGAITAVKVAAGAIDADKIAANAITAAKIATGAITAGKVAANAITATEIAAGTITAAEIATGAITAVKVAAGAIDADKIATNAITAAKIATGAITAGKVAANAITATEIAANAITSAKINAGAVTATQIATNAVTADKIIANAITAAKIATGAITAGKVAANAITATEIAANAITSEKLTANSITARELVLTDFSNLFPNPDFMGGKTDGWELLSGALLTSGLPAPLNAGPTEYSGFKEPGTGTQDLYGFQPIAASPGETYYIECWAVCSGISATRLDIQLRLYNAATPGGSPLGVSFNAIPLTWTKLHGQFTIPAGFDRFKAGLRFPSVTTAGGRLYVSGFRLRRMASAELIVDGAITAAKVAASAITADKIQAGAVTAGKVAANAITATEIAAGAIVADKIATNAITAVKINAGAIEAGKIAANAVTAATIAAGAVTAGKVAANAITATEIAAGAIVADKIATNAITAVKINAGAIEAAKIATNAITADKIAANAVTAAKILAGAIDAGKIAAGAVTAEKITAGAVLADKIAAGAVTAGKIAANAVTATEIAAGSIVAANIAAGAITATKLTISDAANIFPDFDMVDPDLYISPVPLTFSATTSANLGLRYLRILPSASEVTATTQWLPLEQDGQYLLRGRCFNSNTTSGTTAKLSIELATIGASDAIVPSRTIEVQTRTNSTTAAVSTIHFSTTAGEKRFRFVFYKDAVSGGEARFGGLQVRKKAGGELIVDGAVIAAKIAANAVTTEKINAGAVTANEIATNAITAVKVAAGAIEAGKIAANAVTATTIAAGAITAGKIAANAVTATEIAAGTVTATEIATNAITAVKIAAGAIEAAKIAAGAIQAAAIAAGAVNADKIAAGAITTAKLAASAVTANEIAANAVIADKIAANAVTATQISAGAVIAGKIGANAVTANEIAANAITSAKINAGAVTATQIATNAITADKISAGAITTTKLAANAVTANEIAAGSIIAEKLAVLAREYVNPVSTTANLIGWGGVLEDGTGGNAAQTYNATEKAIQLRATTDLSTRCKTWQVNHDKIYRVSMKIRKTAAAGLYYIGVSAFSTNNNGEVATGNGQGPIGVTPFGTSRVAQSGSSNVYFASGTPATTYVDHTYYIVGANRDVNDCPAHAGPGTVPFVKLPESGTWVAVRVLNWSNGGTSRDLFIKDVSVTEVGAGQIVAQNITALAVTAGKIASNAVTAATIAANAVTADKITSNAVTAAKIAALAVSADKIAANAITADKIAANAVTAAKIAAGTITADKIAANFLRAAFINTGGLDVTEGNNRVRIRPNNQTPILFEVNGQPTFSVNVDGTGFFAGKLAANTVDANAITDEAKKAINPAYTGGGEKFGTTGTSVRMVSGATFDIGTFTTLSAGDRVSIALRLQEAVEWFEGVSAGPKPTYTASTYQIQIQRRSGSANAFVNIVPTINLTITPYEFGGFTPPGEPYNPIVTGYSYDLNQQFTDTLPTTNNHVTYRLVVTRTSGTGATAQGLLRRQFIGEKAAYKLNEIRGTTIKQFIDKETGFSIVTAQETMSGNSTRFISFPTAFAEVYGCTVGWDANNDTGQRIHPRYRSLTTSSVMAVHPEPNISNARVTVTVTGRVAV